MTQSQISQVDLPPFWWSDLQNEMGQLLRAPLNRQGERFSTASPPSTLLKEFNFNPNLNDSHKLNTSQTKYQSLHQRFDLYQRQYWMRLFNALQRSLPYTTQALTPFEFNQLVTLYFIEYPPQVTNLEKSGVQFLKVFKLRLWRLLSEILRDVLPTPTSKVSDVKVRPPPLKSLMKVLVEQKGITYTLSQLKKTHHSSLPLNPLQFKLTDQELNRYWCTQLLNLSCPITLLDQALRLDDALQGSFLNPPTQKLASNRHLPQLLEYPYKRSKHCTIVKEIWPQAHLSRERVETEPPPSKPHIKPIFWIFSRTKQGPQRVEVNSQWAFILTHNHQKSIHDLCNILVNQLDADQRQSLMNSLPQFIEQGLAGHWWSEINSKSN